MPKLIWKRVLEGGEWVSRLFAEPASPVLPDQPAPELKPDDGLADIRAVAAMLRRDQMPPPDLLARISDERMRWLTACTDKMLASIVAADDKSLREHVAGRRAIRGVLITDPETVAAYRRPVATDAGIVDEDDLAWAPAL
jgi:hypothetical protein